VIDPKPSSRRFSGMVRDIATKLQPGISCVIVNLSVDFGVASLNGLILANFQKIPEMLCQKRFQIDPETSYRYVSGTATDIATKI
jgi:hypothetical protein